MFTFEQRSGHISHNGVFIGTGYSGHGPGLNNPAMEAVSCTGPIPRGVYRIGAEFVHPVAGPVCMRLSAEPPTDTHGREGFMIHGDNSHADQSASEGCIVTCRPVRILIAESVAAGDDMLEVLAG